MTALHRPTLPFEEVEYPESDGQPVAETDVHRDAMFDLIERLRLRYRDRDDVYVSGDNFVYFEEGNRRAVVSPDVYVVFGVPRGLRRVYKVWEEGQPPTVVFELTSRSTRREDEGSKKAKCARIGVREYWLFDPEFDYLKPALQGYQLRAGRYEPIEPEADGGLRSEVLGVTLRLDGPRLVLRDSETGEPVLTATEVEHMARMAAESELARLRAELERLDG
jgi:Uma2 family endonuclease